VIATGVICWQDNSVKRVNGPHVSMKRWSLVIGTYPFYDLYCNFMGRVTRYQHTDGPLAQSKTNSVFRNKFIYKISFVLFLFLMSAIQLI
jgi:hypothetical protein